MLKRVNRLRLQKDIEAVLKSGVRRKGDFFRVHFLRKDAPAGARITVVAGAKELRKATQRNRLKRRTREVVRMILPDLSLGDYMIFPLRTALDASFQELQRELTHHVHSIKDHYRHH